MAGRGLGRVLRRVVEEHDAAGLDIFGHAPGYLIGGQPLPVQTVHVPLHGRDAERVHGVDDVVVVLAVGGSGRAWPDAGQGLYLVACRR